MGRVILFQYIEELYARTFVILYCVIMCAKFDNTEIIITVTQNDIYIINITYIFDNVNIFLLIISATPNIR